VTLGDATGDEAVEKARVGAGAGLVAVGVAVALTVNLAVGLKKAVELAATGVGKGGACAAVTVGGAPERVGVPVGVSEAASPSIVGVDVEVRVGTVADTAALKAVAVVEGTGVTMASGVGVDIVAAGAAGGAWAAAGLVDARDGKRTAKKKVAAATNRRPRDAAGITAEAYSAALLSPTT
jgi:hypothetical protein